MPPVPPGQTARTSKRGDLLDAARRAFAVDGYRNASMNAIAAEAGVTRQGLLYYFPSKSDLLLAVIAQRDEEEGAEAPDLIERHLSLSESMLETLRRHATPQGAIVARLFTVLAAESIEAEHPAHDYFVGRYRRAREILVKLIAQEQTLGRITNRISPENLAMTLCAVMDGLQLQAHLEPEPLGVEVAFAQLMALLEP